MELGKSPAYYFYGEINDLGESITLTAFLVPYALKSSAKSASIRIASSAVTDKLLNKPVRKITLPAPSMPATPAQTGTPGRFPTVEDENMRFQVTSARRISENRLLIEIATTNLDNVDREWDLIGSRTLAYDNSGNEYGIKKHAIANKEAGTYESIRHRFIPGITTTIKLQFDAINPGATTVTLIQIAIYEAAKGNRVTNIRNIPINP
jgi:hypothetical protein